MAHVVKLRVKDTTASTGTGAKVLARSSLLNFRTFDSVMANGDTCDAIVVNRSANQWEHSSWTIAGVGGEPVLTRLEFKESSTGAPVLFTEGTKDVLMLYPVAGKLDFTARTLKLVTNIIDGTPGTASAFRLYDDGNGWIGGLGVSSGTLDIRSGWNLNLWSGQTGNQRNTVRVNQNGLSVAVGAAVASGIEPAAALHVVNHGAAPSAIITTGTNTAVRIGPNGLTSAIEGVDYTGPTAWRPLFINGEEVLIGTGGYERMRVNWDGNVGIGTTVVGAKFHVQGTGFNGGNGYFVSTDSANSVAIKGTNGVAIFDTAYVALMDGTRTIYLGLSGTAAGGDVGRFRIIGANGQENFSIGTTGNVGIGTTNPVTKLDVMGTTTGVYERLARFGNAGNSRYINIGVENYGNQVPFIQSYHMSSDANPWNLALNPYGANIGIGILEPTFKLHLRTTDEAPHPMLLAGTTKGIRFVTKPDGAAIEGVDYTGAVSFEPLRIGGSTLALHISAVDKVFLNANGLGIGGWAQAGYLLDVSGNPGLKVRFKNWGTTGSASEVYQDVGGRFVYRGVHYDGRYLHEYGSSVETRYSDFDAHVWRGSDGIDRMVLDGTGLGIGRFPGTPLDVMMAGYVTTGYHPVANFGVYNAAAGAAFTRMYVGQVSTNIMFLEVADKDNVKGILNLQPYGGPVSVGPLLGANDPFSVQMNYDGHLNTTVYNHNIGDWAAAKFNLVVRDRHVSRMVYYKDRWVQDKGVNVEVHYSDFDTHIWRTNAGADKMVLHSNNVIWLGNTAGGDPTTPVGGGYIYIAGGALKYRGSGGTITTLAPA